MTATADSVRDAEERRRRADAEAQIYERARRRLIDAHQVIAQLHRVTLDAILTMRDHAGSTLIDGGTPGASRPHPGGGRGDIWLDLDELAAVDIATTVKVNEGVARSMVWRAVQSRTRFAPATAALGAGGMTEWKLRTLIDETDICTDEVARRVQAAVLPHATVDTATRFARRVRDEVIRADGDQAAQRRAAAVRDRYVSIRPDADGMATLFAQHSALNLKAVDTALSELAGTAGPDDTRTLGQRRADALVAAVLGPGAVHCTAHTQTSLAFDEDGSYSITAQDTQQAADRLNEIHDQLSELNWTIPRPPLVTVHVTIPATVLAGADRATNNPTTKNRCDAVPRVGVAYIDGLGPVDPDLARQLAADARWMRMITDPVTGVVRDVGTTVYAFPAAMDRRIKARDQHCRFPGCSRTTRRCQTGHVTPYPNGPTAEANALSLCTRHHRVKHQTRWRTTIDPDGTAHWTSPTGSKHRTKPPGD